MEQTIRCRALKTVYIVDADDPKRNVRVRENDVFTLQPRLVTVYNVAAGRPELDEKGKVKMRLLSAEDQFSPISMDRVSDSEPERLTTAQQALSMATENVRRRGRPPRVSPD